MVAVRSLGRVATLFGAYEIIRAEYPDDVMMRRWVCRQIMMTSSHALIKRDLYSGVNGQIMGEIHGELRRNFNVSVVMKMERPKERVQVVLAYFCPTLGWTLSKMWRGGKRLQGRK